MTSRCRVQKCRLYLIASIKLGIIHVYKLLNVLWMFSYMSCQCAISFTLVLTQFCSNNERPIKSSHTSYWWSHYRDVAEFERVYSVCVFECCCLIRLVFDGFSLSVCIFSFLFCSCWRHMLSKSKPRLAIYPVSWKLHCHTNQNSSVKVPPEDSYIHVSLLRFKLISARWVSKPIWKHGVYINVY